MAGISEPAERVMWVSESETDDSASRRLLGW